MRAVYAPPLSWTFRTVALMGQVADRAVTLSDLCGHAKI
jgi:hypothetical protein